MFKQTANAMTHESRNTTFLKSKSFFLKKQNIYKIIIFSFSKKALAFLKMKLYTILLIRAYF